MAGSTWGRCVIGAVAAAGAVIALAAPVEASHKPGQGATVGNFGTCVAGGMSPTELGAFPGTYVDNPNHFVFNVPPRSVNDFRMCHYVPDAP